MSIILGKASDGRHFVEQESGPPSGDINLFGPVTVDVEDTSVQVGVQDVSIQIQVFPASIIIPAT